jgi:NAD(P)-dependent dehydrogenase (short-subunit alcohol dehydrogenase family)
MILINKNIILTGAGRGIGRIIAQHCAEEGASLALMARTKQELQETLTLIRDTPGKHFIVCTDLSISDDIIKGYKIILKHFKTIDVLVNNAGIQHPIGPFYLNNIEDWKNNIGINLFGTIELTHHVIQNMISRRKGKILNISGGGSTSARPNFSAYAVSKTAIVRFTETLAEELKEFSIYVNSLAPGAINTRMLDEVLESGTLAGQELVDAVKRQKTGGTDPTLVARLIVFLASDQSDGITGKLISAPWDPWCDTNFQNLLKTDLDIATLRRIDNKSYIKKA